jgi:hypothetical protein
MWLQTILVEVAHSTLIVMRQRTVAFQTTRLIVASSAPKVSIASISSVGANHAWDVEALQQLLPPCFMLWVGASGEESKKLRIDVTHTVDVEAYM